MLAPAPAKIRCRQITKQDLPAAAALLLEGFPRRKLQHWQSGLERMTERAVPENAPQLGYCLDVNGTLVGIILLIASERIVDGVTANFTNVASWYVKPEYRPYAHQLAAMALKNRTTSYLNVTAAPHTWPVVENQGYRKYCNGLFFGFALLAKPVAGVKFHSFAGVVGREDIKAWPDFALLQRHAAWGCEVVVAEEAGNFSGYIFRRYAIRSGAIKLPAMFVVKAPSQGELVRLAGNLGRHLLKKAAPILVMDANGPVPGLIGHYTEKRGRKFVKGPNQPALCDLADTEFAVFEI
jgi:hypothetical protein